MGRGADDRRITATVSADTYMKAEALALAKDISLSELLRLALDRYIAAGGVEPLPELLLARIDQLCDLVSAQDASIRNLVRVDVGLAETYTRLFHGGNYLQEEDDTSIL